MSPPSNIYGNASYLNERPRSPQNQRLRPNMEILMSPPRAQRAFSPNRRYVSPSSHRRSLSPEMNRIPSSPRRNPPSPPRLSLDPRPQSRSPPRQRVLSHRKPAGPIHHMEAAKPGTCPRCDSEIHMLEDCQSFLEMSASRKWAFINRFANVCSKCLKTGHNHNICGRHGNHHPLLHLAKDGNLVDLDNEDENEAPMPKECTFCHSKSHALPDCPELFCHICRSTGHMPQHCPRRVKKIDVCEFCKMSGHGISVCPIVTCLRCRRTGHTDLTCTNTEVNMAGTVKNCFQCGAAGHMADNCPRSTCLKCGIAGHLVKNCRNICSECGRKGKYLMFFCFLFVRSES